MAQPTHESPTLAFYYSSVCVDIIEYTKENWVKVSVGALQSLWHGIDGARAALAVKSLRNKQFAQA